MNALPFEVSVKGANSWILTVTGLSRMLPDKFVFRRLMYQSFSPHYLAHIQGYIVVLYAIILVYYIQGHTHLISIASHIFLNNYIFPP